jgi:hypothetical protein
MKQYFKTLQATGHLNNGMYLLRIFNDENKLIHSEKITIVH